MKERGLNASKATFYRELQQFRQPVEQPALPRPLGRPGEHTVVLPRPVAPVTGEALSSYLTSPRPTPTTSPSPKSSPSLPSWFTTKINNPDELSQHHMLVPATTDALNALARLARTTPQPSPAHYQPSAPPDTRGPVRATTACRSCTARRGISEPVPVHLPST